MAFARGSILRIPFRYRSYGAAPILTRRGCKYFAPRELALKRGSDARFHISNRPPL